MLICFFTHCTNYDNIISLTSLKFAKGFHLLLGFAENQGVFWDFKIQNSVWIMEIWIIKVLLYMELRNTYVNR